LALGVAVTVAVGLGAGAGAPPPPPDGAALADSGKERKSNNEKTNFSFIDSFGK